MNRGNNGAARARRRGEAVGQGGGIRGLPLRSPFLTFHVDDSSAFSSFYPSEKTSSPELIRVAHSSLLPSASLPALSMTRSDDTEIDIKIPQKQNTHHFPVDLQAHDDVLGLERHGATAATAAAATAAASTSALAALRRLGIGGPAFLGDLDIRSSSSSRGLGRRGVGLDGLDGGGEELRAAWGCGGGVSADRGRGGAADASLRGDSDGRARGAARAHRGLHLVGDGCRGCACDVRKEARSLGTREAGGCEMRRGNTLKQNRRIC